MNHALNGLNIMYFFVLPLRCTSAVPATDQQHYHGITLEWHKYTKSFLGGLNAAVDPFSREIYYHVCRTSQNSINALTCELAFSNQSLQKEFFLKKMTSVMLMIFSQAISMASWGSLFCHSIDDFKPKFYPLRTGWRINSCTVACDLD